MIELTTGMVLLMSSIYGSSQAMVDTSKIATTETPATTTQATTTDASSFTVDQNGNNDSKQIEKYLKGELDEYPILVNIARCESEFRQFDKDGSVIRGRAVPDDIGLFQINERYHGETARKLKMDIHSIHGNIAYAKHLYEEQGTKPWNASSKCWNNGIALK